MEKSATLNLRVNPTAEDAREILGIKRNCLRDETTQESTYKE